MRWKHEQTPEGGLCCSQGTHSPVFPPRISLGRPWLGSWRGTWPRLNAGNRVVAGGLSLRIAQSQKAKAREALLGRRCGPCRERRLCRRVFTRRARAGSSSSAETDPGESDFERPLWVALHCCAYPHVPRSVPVSSLVGKLIGVEVELKESQALALQGFS